MRTFARRLVLVLAAAGLVACSKAGGGGGGATNDTDSGSKFTAPEYSMGNPNAKVTVVEYASVTCPHCAQFDADVFPKLKAKYIDTGKVQYIYREFLIHPELDAAGYLTARCVGKDKYFKVVEAIMRSQPEIFQGGDMRGVLLRIAQSSGLTEAQFNTCLQDETALKALKERQDKAVSDQHIEGTPSFLINGKPLDTGTREPGMADFDTALPPLLSKS